MKATLEFNLPEDQSEYNYAFDGAQAHFALADIFQYLRECSEYAEDLVLANKLDHIKLMCMKLADDRGIQV